MNNLYEFNLKTHFKKLACDGLLFVEYQCVPGDMRSNVWSQHSYIAFIQSGTKTWITPDGEIPVTAGDAIFCKKGAHSVKNHYEEKFCALLFFLTDDFIRQVVIGAASQNEQQDLSSAIMRLQVNIPLKIYFESMISYLLQPQPPTEQLLKLKFTELILQLLTGHNNQALAGYFNSLAKKEKASLKQLMLDNYLYPLSQEDFAKLAHRSLTSFKRDFQEVFGTSLNKWLIEMRLKYARLLLAATEDSVNSIAGTSGFETTAHFIRCFKKQYQLPPQQFRQQNHSFVSSSQVLTK